MKNDCFGEKCEGFCWTAVVIRSELFLSAHFQLLVNFVFGILDPGVQRLNLVSLNSQWMLCRTIASLVACLSC
jgi:hypothetical protein